MFNFHTVNTAEVNAGSSPPDTPALTLSAGEDINALSWTSPLFTDFFKVYWSNVPFASVDDPGVRIIDSRDDSSSFIPGSDPSVIVSYDHAIPAAYSLSVLYYRISAFNENGETLSEQLDSYNFRLAIYQQIFEKTIEDLTLRFTPEIRRQYEDSKLWRSFVQSLCSELATGRFEIKEAIKQMNLQKAVNVFLNLWNNITGISRLNLTDTDGNLVPETDAQYRQRLVNSIFWDKISNLALKKTLLLNLGYEADVLDEGPDPTDFRVTPGTTSVFEYVANHGPAFVPGEYVLFYFIGPSPYALCVSDDGTTLTYSSISAPLPGMPIKYVGYFSAMEALDDGYITPTTARHQAITNPNPTVLNAGDVISFTGLGGNYAEGVVVSNIGGVLKFRITLGFPQLWDRIYCPLTAASSILTSSPSLTTAVGATVNSKLLSNIYSVNLGVSALPDDALDTIYEEISPLGALGNVLMKILQDVSETFEDWDTLLGNIPYGPIWMGHETNAGIKSTASNWSIAEEIFIDNQLTMSSGRRFYGNDGPDDIIIMTRMT